MAAVTIQLANGEISLPRFRAVSGGRESVGRTMGEALDALTADWGDDVPETAVLIQRFQPDAYFTAVQQDRMKELLARRSNLTVEQRAELEALVDAELDATVARTHSLLPPPQP